MNKVVKGIVIAGIIVALLGAAGFYYVKNNQDVVLSKIFDLAEAQFENFDADASVKAELSELTDLARGIFAIDDTERTFLVLLQNNMELRPGGGFIGQYAVITIKNAQVTDWLVRDANHLDKEVDSDIPAPPSFQKWLNIDWLAFRDSNWEIDFPTNAQAAMKLHNMGDNPQDFDGVIAMNARILDDILEIVGDTLVPGYEDRGAFTAGQSSIQLLDIVEKPVLLDKMRSACITREKETGIEEECGTDPETGEKIKKLTEEDRVYRKAVLPILAETLGQKIFGSPDDSISTRLSLVRENVPALLEMFVANLRDRDVQMWFVSEDLQSIVEKNNWGTVADTQWDKDYVAVVDANLGALKSDYYINRSLEYTVDFTGSNAEVNDATSGRMVRYLTPQVLSQAFSGTFKTQTPLATMRMSYEHTAERANYRTSDYHAYTRLYTPADTKWYVREWFFEPGEELDVYGNKKAFTYKFDIFIGDTLPTLLQYALPEKITEDGYELKIQSQSGVESLPTVVTIITSDGTELTKEFVLERDAIVRLIGEGDTRELTVELL